MNGHQFKFKNNLLHIRVVDIKREFKGKKNYCESVSFYFFIFEKIYFACYNQGKIDFYAPVLGSL